MPTKARVLRVVVGSRNAQFAQRCQPITTNKQNKTKTNKQKNRKKKNENNV